jgi:hypothetical protein
LCFSLRNCFRPIRTDLTFVGDKHMAPLLDRDRFSKV